MGKGFLLLLNWTLFFFGLSSPRSRLVLMYDFSTWIERSVFDRFAYSSVNIENSFRSGESQPRNSNQKRENSHFDDGDIHKLLFR